MKENGEGLDFRFFNEFAPSIMGNGRSACETGDKQLS